MRKLFWDWLEFLVWRLKMWGHKPVFVYYVVMQDSKVISQGNDVIWINMGTFKIAYPNALPDLVSSHLKENSDHKNTDAYFLIKSMGLL